MILKIILRVIAVVIICYLLLVGYLILGPAVKSLLNRKSFNSQEWKSHTNERNPVKLNMVDDLLSSHQLVGMSKKEVEELLGKPPVTGYFKEYDYVYWLGPERGAFGIDSEWLGIKFKDGNVIKIEILRD